MFSKEFFDNFDQEIQILMNRSRQNRTFQQLYDKSLVFQTFQSYVHRHQLIQTIKENRNKPIEDFLSRSMNYHDIRACECADYVMRVYVKLVEYHTNLYEIYEKIPDEKRDFLRLKQFDRIMFYRLEICQLLLRCRCIQRLIVEIENGRKFLSKFRDDLESQNERIFRFQCQLVEHHYSLLEANVAQKRRATADAKRISRQNLQLLERISAENLNDENLVVQNHFLTSNTVKEKRESYQRNKDDSADNSPASLSSLPLVKKTGEIL